MCISYICCWCDWRKLISIAVLIYEIYWFMTGSRMRSSLIWSKQLVEGKCFTLVLVMHNFHGFPKRFHKSFDWVCLWMVRENFFVVDSMGVWEILFSCFYCKYLTELIIVHSRFNKLIWMSTLMGLLECNMLYCCW